MRVFATVLLLILVSLQYRLWVSDQGMGEVVRLRAAIAAQSSANREQAGRNRQVAAEVTDLKLGLTALEERARSELGMVGLNETFYQIVTPGPDIPAAPTIITGAAPITAGGAATGGAVMGAGGGATAAAAVSAGGAGTGGAAVSARVP
jgi:cell division protein FtsB